MSALITLAEAKAALNLSASRTNNDAELWNVITGVSEFIEQRCGPCSVQQRTYVADCNGGAIVLPFRPILSLTSLTPVPAGTGVSYDVTQWDVDTSAGVITPYLRATPGKIRVVCNVGRRFVPEALRQAAKLYVQDIWVTQRVNNATNNDDVMMPIIGQAVPPKVLAMMAPSMLIGGIA